jgi:hypothetical protein
MNFAPLREMLLLIQGFFHSFPVPSPQPLLYFQGGFSGSNFSNSSISEAS